MPRSLAASYNAVMMLKTGGAEMEMDFAASWSSWLSMTAAGVIAATGSLLAACSLCGLCEPDEDGMKREAGELGRRTDAAKGPVASRES